MVRQVDRSEVVEACWRAHFMQRQTLEKSITNQLLTEMVRRGATAHCPCTRGQLRQILEVALRGLCDQDDEIVSEAIDDAIESLLIIGDLLEAHLVDGTRDAVWQKVIRVSAPSFVKRSDGRIIILGACDSSGALPDAVAQSITYQNDLRLLEQTECIVDLEEQLVGSGFQEMSERTWLTHPNITDPNKLIQKVLSSLSDVVPTDPVEVAELRILDTEKDVRYYTKRWVQPNMRTGTFVGRRPQEFRAPIWCIAELDGGKVSRLLDLPLANAKWRGCDWAWHLQAAFDMRNGAPQVYARKQTQHGVQFNLFSPLPMWAERRLRIFGRKCKPSSGLFSYVVSNQDAHEEEEFLRDFLWLQRMDDRNREQ